MSHTQERLVLTSQDDYPTGCANFESRGLSGADAIVLYHDNAKADARRIVRCWNSHDAMFAELRECGAALTALLERDPDLMSRVCGSTTLGNRLIHVQAALHQCAATKTEAA